MKSSFEQTSATTRVSLISLVLLTLSFAILGGVPRAAALSTSGDCTSPSVPAGTLPALSPFNLTLIGGSGQTFTVNQDTIFSFAACTSNGGFVKGGASDQYGNYTGVPILTLLGLVGGISNGQTVTATGSDGFAATYTYQEVVSGLGWNEFNRTTLSPISTPIPLTLVLAYMMDNAALAPNPGPGPLRTVILSPSGVLTSPGSQWVKFVVKIQVNGAPSPVPEFPPGASPQAGAALAAALGLVALFAVRRRFFPQLGK
jgi:hypothetical protein